MAVLSLYLHTMAPLKSCCELTRLRSADYIAGTLPDRGTSLRRTSTIPTKSLVVSLANIEGFPLSKGMVEF